MSKFFYNRATTRIYAKKPFIVIEYNCDCFGFGKFSINNCVFYSPGWTNLKTTVKTEILPLNVVNDQLVTFFVPSECLSFGQNLLQLVFRQICKMCNLRFFSALFLFLVGSGPKRAQQDLYRASTRAMLQIWFSYIYSHYSPLGRFNLAWRNCLSTTGAKLQWGPRRSSVLKGGKGWCGRGLLETSKLEIF